ncbi:hypothetical protein LHYA1_G002043 [Lachnellula hyalina]|uniref:Uncharacterized protein n=1 Tax=Lachnellula hyalina TaxID=1316788 RepID=A0A8H8U0W4_9HELO|nr:uncharacterized protein LHYA1_G002043 [Lachnellula hyalina]TVY29770.1 hypothetical protein LHYA1_G002043 [Lachnellula hyalina]
MILFETNTSVFEILWDIALALFIIRIAFVYFLLSFISGAIVVYFRIAEITPLHHLTQPQSDLTTFSIWLIAITLWARYSTVAYQVPRVGGFRLAIGALATVFMLCAELVGGVVLYEKGYVAWTCQTDLLAAGLGVGSLGVYGLMPWLLMKVEQESDEMGETYHGHEKKPIVAAVPTVALTEKSKQNGKKHI